MAVTTFREIHDGRDGSDEVKGRQAVRRYTRVFRATTDSAFDDANTVVASASCPRLGAVYPYDTGAWCRSRRANSPHKMVWIVTAGYSSEREMEEDPSADPPQFTWSTQQFQKAAAKDRDGKAIVNSAGDPFDPPAEMDDSRWSCTMTRNVLNVPTWLLSYKDAVNDAAFTIDGVSVDAGSAKLQAVSIGPAQVRNDITFRQLSLTMTFAPTFALEILDAGFNYKDVDAGKTQKILIKDEQGNWVEPTAPRMLNGNGQHIPNPTPADGVLLDFDVYEEKDFSALPLS